MTLPEASGGQPAGDAQDRYAGIISTVPAGLEKAPEEKVEEKPEPEVKPEASAEEQEGEQEEAEPRKPKKGGYTRKLERLEALVASMAEKLEGKPAEQTAKSEPEGKPKPENFDTWDAYYEALADWKLETKLKSKTEQESQAKLREQADGKVKAFQAKAAEYAKQVPDYAEALEDAEAPMTPALQQALLDSDMGPQVAYYLAKNPEIALKASQMGLIEVNKLVGRVEAILEREAAKPVVKKTTNAPEPIKPVGNGKAAKVWTLDDPDIPYEEYVKLRGKR